MQQELRHQGDLLAVLRRRSINGGLILSLSHHLLAQIGVLDLGDIGSAAEDGLRLIHHRLQLILETERFLQIHSSFTPLLV